VWLFATFCIIFCVMGLVEIGSKIVSVFSPATTAKGSSETYVPLTNTTSNYHNREKPEFYSR